MIKEPKLRTTLRCAMYQDQLYYILKLIENLGGNTLGRSYSSCLQQLIEWVIKTTLDQGLILPTTEDEISLFLMKRSPELRKEKLKIKAFDYSSEEFLALKEKLPGIEQLKSDLGDSEKDIESSDEDLDSLFK